MNCAKCLGDTISLKTYTDTKTNMLYNQWECSKCGKTTPITNEEKSLYLAIRKTRTENARTQ